MLINAYTFFKDKKFLDSALKAGEVIWERGILLKGNGLCHGISGNAYMLHSLYRATHDLKWLHRTYCFCAATYNKDI